MWCSYLLPAMLILNNWLICQVVSIVFLIIYVTIFLFVITKYFETKQISCFYLHFCKQTFASVAGSCVEQWQLWCSNGYFLFPHSFYLTSLELFSMGELSLLPYLFIYPVVYLHQHGLMDNYSFLSLYSNAIPIYSVAQVVPTLAIRISFRLAPMHFHHALILFLVIFFWAFFTFWHQNMLQVPLVLSLPMLRTPSVLLGVLVPFFLENGI